MSDSKSQRIIFTTGGTVQASNGVYLSRPADNELLKLCRQSTFSYILTARQLGKSSLMTRTAERLTEEGIRTVIVDLTSLGINAPPEEWFLSLLTTIEDQLTLDTNVVTWWQKHSHLTIAKRLSNFFEEVLLTEVAEPVVIFIDEIDTTLNLDFTDDLFAVIRSLHNARAQTSLLQRLSFVLIGVATPSDLIRNPQITPFNIGQRVELTDFTYEELLPLADGFDLTQARARQQVLRRAHEWTGGHPYLTQRLCNEIAKELAKSGHDDLSSAEVDRIVADTFFGEKSKQDNNLLFVRDMLLKRAPDVSGVLTTYRHILDNIREVIDEEQSLIKSHLKLSGIVRMENGLLKMRNRIYAIVFDQQWVKRHLPVNWRGRFYNLAKMALIFFWLPSTIAVYAWQQRSDAIRQTDQLIKVTQEQVETNRKLRETNDRLEKTQADLRKALSDTEAANRIANKRRVEAESRKAEAERQTVIAEKQRHEANRQATEAERQKDLANYQTVLTERLRADTENLRKVAEERREAVVEGSKETAANKLAYLATSMARIDPTISYYLVDAALKRQSTDEVQNAFRYVVNELTNKIVLKGHLSNVLSAAFSPDGQYIVTGGTERDGDAAIRIWIATTGQLYKTLPGHTRSVQSVEYSRDGQFILSASNDGTARIWNVKTGETTTLAHATIKQGGAIVFSAAYDQDGKYIVTAGVDGTAKLWDAASGRKLRDYFHPIRRGNELYGVKSAAFSPDGKFIVTGCDDSVVRIFETVPTTFPIKPYKELKGHTQLVWSVAYSPNGKFIVSSGNDMTVRIWDARSGVEIREINGHTQRVKKAIFNPDSNSIVTSSGDNSTRIWDVKSGQLIGELKGHIGEVFCAAYSQDKRYIVTASADTTARVWDLTGREFSGHLKAVESVAFSPDSRFIATASRDKEARIWDAATGQTLTKFKRHEGAVWSANYSENGRYIVTACLDNIARILDAKTGQILHELKGHIERVLGAIFIEQDR